MQDNLDNDQNIIEELSGQAIQNFNQELINFEQKIFQSIEQHFQNIENTINEKLSNFKDEVENNVIKETDEGLRKKVIDLKKLDNPPLINLSKLNNSNYLINLILLYLSNIDKLTLYFLKPKHEEKILKKSKEDPTGKYLAPLFLKLLDHLWKSTKKDYAPIEIHKELKVLMKTEEYNSINPGTIINFIVFQLNNELNFNTNIINEPEWNYDKNKAKENFVNYYRNIKNEITDEFFSSIKIKKFTQNNNFIFLYKFNIVFDLYLDNSNSKILSLENNFKELYFGNRDKNKYCKQNEQLISKEVYTIPKILIINIIRNKNNKQILNYPKVLEDRYILGNPNFQPQQYELNAVIINKNENNKDIFYAYIKSFINKKWYLYNSKGIYDVFNENEIKDGENSILLIYQQK